MIITGGMPDSVVPHFMKPFRQYMLQIARDSGTFKGKRMTGGGRGDVRAKLYMPTLVAIQHNPAIREFYQRLLKAGKTKMTAVTACMRKMLTILNVMVAKKEYWKSEFNA
jgi:transposase